jgi:hypothetical protein
MRHLITSMPYTENQQNSLLQGSGRFLSLTYERKFIRQPCFGNIVASQDCHVGPKVVLRGDFDRIIFQQDSVQDHCVMHGFLGKDCILEVNRFWPKQYIKLTSINYYVSLNQFL